MQINDRVNKVIILGKYNHVKGYTYVYKVVFGFSKRN